MTKRCNGSVCGYGFHWACRCVLNEMTLDQMGAYLVQCAQQLRAQRGEVWYRDYFAFRSMMRLAHTKVGELPR
jgi:hypothetical protein